MSCTWDFCKLITIIEFIRCTYDVLYTWYGSTGSMSRHRAMGESGPEAIKSSYEQTIRSKGGGKKTFGHYGYYWNLL